MTIDKLFYTDEAMRSDLRSIIREMGKKRLRPDYVLGIARGGLIPATLLSHYFDAPLLTAKVSLRDHKETMPLDHVAKVLNEGKIVLMVDDICDSGDTLKYIWDTLFEMCPTIAPQPLDSYGQPYGTTDATVVERNLHTAVLIHNEGEKLFDPDYVGTSINKRENDAWVVFPWEEWWAE